MRKRVVKNKKKTATRIALLIAAPLLIAGIVVGVTLYKDYQNTPCLTDELPAFNAEDCVYNGSGILYLAEDKLVYSDLSDKKNDYSLSVSGEGATLAASTGLSVLYNASGVQIIGLSYPIEFSGSLMAVRCGASYVAGLRRDSQSKVSLQIFSKTEQVDQIDFSDDYLIDFGFTSPSENTMWTLTQDVTSSVPVHTLTTYDMDARTTTGVMTQRNQLIEEVRFTQNSVFAIGTNHIVRYNSVGNNQAYRVLVYGYRMLDFSSEGEKPMFLFVPRGDEELSTVKLYTLAEADTADEQIASVKLPSGALAAFLSKGRLVALTADAMYIYSANGTLSSTTKLEFTATAYKKLSDTYVLAAGDFGNTLLTIR